MKISEILTQKSIDRKERNKLFLFTIGIGLLLEYIVYLVFTYVNPISNVVHPVVAGVVTIILCIAGMLINKFCNSLLMEYVGLAIYIISFGVYGTFKKNSFLGVTVCYIAALIILYVVLYVIPKHTKIQRALEFQALKIAYLDIGILIGAIALVYVFRDNIIGTIIAKIICIIFLVQKDIIEEQQCYEKKYDIDAIRITKYCSNMLFYSSLFINIAAF